MADLNSMIAIAIALGGGAVALTSEIAISPFEAETLPYTRNTEAANDLVLKNTLRRGDKVFVPVEIEGSVIEFMVDTGSSYTILSARDAEALGIIRGETVFIDTVGGVAALQRAEVSNLTVAGVTISNAPFLVSDATSVSLFGMDMLSRHGATRIEL